MKQLDRRTRLERYLRGELTWAEVEGITWEQARAIAETGCELARQGRLEEARVLFEGLTEVNPRDAASRAALGTVYQQLGREDDALREYTRVLERDAMHPVALANRGELYLRRGEQRRGLTDVAHAVEADPRGDTPAGRRARALLQALTAVEDGKEAPPAA